MDQLPYTQPSYSDLHAHLTSSVPPRVYWKVAHAHGFKLPYKTYFDFVSGIVISPTNRRTLKDYLDNIYHPLLNKLSSGSHEVEETTYEAFAGAHRQGITIMELRLNPMKHNKGGEVDLDHLILSCLRGMERALLEYPTLWGGVIFCLDRQFKKSANKVIVQKAIKYQSRGVIGIDFANYGDERFSYKDYADIVQNAKDAGLKVTAHTGETNDTDDIDECIAYIKPHRIGHGIRAAKRPDIMQKLAAEHITLEICPIGNLATNAIRDVEELKQILSSFIAHGVSFCLNTDWPETVERNKIKDIYDLMRTHQILSEEQIQSSIQVGRDATFINMNRPYNIYI